MPTHDTWPLFPSLKSHRNNKNTNESDVMADNISDHHDFSDFYNLDFSDSQSFGMPQITIAKKVAIVLSIIAILANLLSLLAISKTKKQSSANLRLIISLCSADTVVAVSLLFNSVDTKLAPLGNKNGHLTCLFQVFRSLRYGSHIVTLLNLLGLALDHYYAIVKTLRHRLLTNSRKVSWTIVGMWIVSMTLGFSDFYIPSKYHDHCADPSPSDGNSSYSFLSTCERVSCSVYDPEHLVFATTFLIFFLLTWIYASIFLSLRRNNQRLLLSRQHKRKKQGVVTTSLILGTFVACWLPYVLFQSSVSVLVSRSTGSHQRGEVLHLLRIHIQANYCLYDLILLNSLCDPIIYACRMREVKRGYRNLAASLCPQYRAARKQGTLSSTTISSNTRSRSQGSPQGGSGKGTRSTLASESGTSAVVDS